MLLVQTYTPLNALSKCIVYELSASIALPALVVVYTAYCALQIVRLTLHTFPAVIHQYTGFALMPYVPPLPPHTQ